MAGPVRTRPDTSAAAPAVSWLVKGRSRCCGRSRVRTWVGEADGFTALSSCPSSRSLNSAYVARGAFPSRRRPPCVRGRPVSGLRGPRTATDRPTDGAEKATDGAGRSGYAGRLRGFLPLT